MASKGRFFKVLTFPPLNFILFISFNRISGFPPVINFIGSLITNVLFAHSLSKPSLSFLSAYSDISAGIKLFLCR